MEGRYNVRSPAVKRLMKEAQELSEPTDQYFAQPLEDDLFEWHFTVRGPADSDFQNGIYHGRIILPVDYPMKPPSIIWLTPNGRFETNKKICLSISGHHPESWQPSWSIRTALLAIIGFMPTHPGGAIGSLDYKPEERKMLAKKSHSWKCHACGDVQGILLEPTPESKTASNEAKELAAQITFQGEKSKSKTEESPTHGSQKNQFDSSKSENKTPSPSTTVTSAQAGSTNVVINKSAADSQSSSGGTGITTGNANPAPVIDGIGAPTFNTLPSSGLPLPPWNHTSPSSFQPYNFYPAHSISPNMSSMPAQFPYPPSYYTMTSPIYPPGCPQPPSIGMFPCPFLPPPPPPVSPPPASSILMNSQHNFISVNNSSAQSSGQGRRAQTSVTYTRSPMTVPVVSAHQPPSHEVRPQATSDQESIEKRERRVESKIVFNELLAKVKRVGSDESSTVAQTNEDKNTIETSALKEDDIKSTSVDKEESIKTSVNKVKNAAAEPHGESEILQSCHSYGDVTNSDAQPRLSDTENSEAGVPPLEMSESEQRSLLEKSTCNSASELDKCKGKQPLPKGLRQRQSATASVNSEIGEEVQATHDSPTNPTGQRIEAESGDSGQRTHRPGFQGPRLRPVTRDVSHDPQPRQRPYDVTFYLMVFFLVSTVSILLNRVFGVYGYP